MTENSCESKRTRLGLKVRKGKLIDTSTTIEKTILIQ